MTRTISLFTAVMMLSASLAYGSFRKNGVEIGNGRGVDDKGGFEIGNGSLANDMYKLGKIVGRWKVEMLQKFTNLTAVSEEPVKARADLDVQKMEHIQTPDDLLAEGEEAGWAKVSLGKAQAIKRESVSMSGIREITFRIYHSPGQVIKITLVGSERTNTMESFKNLLETFNSFEVLG